MFRECLVNFTSNLIWLRQTTFPALAPTSAHLYLLSRLLLLLDVVHDLEEVPDDAWSDACKRVQQKPQAVGVLFTDRLCACAHCV